jgi:hypothetical protein
LTMKKFSEKPRLLICRISELLSSISVFKQHLTHLYWRHVFLIFLITGLLPSDSNNEYIAPKDSRVLRELLENAGCTDPSSYLLFSSFFSYASSHCKRSLRFHGKRLITGVPSKNTQRHGTSRHNGKARHMSDEESKQSAYTSLGEVANRTHMEYCSNCGKKIEKRILSKGYVFCSDQCRESFTASR